MIELLFCMHVVLLLSAWFTSGREIEPVLFCIPVVLCCSPPGHVIEPVLFCMHVILCYSLPGLPVGTWLSLY